VFVRSLVRGGNGRQVMVKRGGGGVNSCHCAVASLAQQLRCLPARHVTRLLASCVNCTACVGLSEAADTDLIVGNSSPGVGVGQAKGLGGGGVRAVVAKAAGGHIESSTRILARR
jgi:hypothetical protein